VRCFNTCGPRQRGRYGMVIPRLIRNALTGKPLQVFGSGEQTRCFSYVGDVVRGVMQLAESSDTPGEVFNIGTDEEVSINELARRVNRITGSASPIVHIPYEEVYGTKFEDMNRRVPDLTKIRQFVGYRPSVTLDELLRLTVAHIRTQMDDGVGVLEVPTATVPAVRSSA